MTALTELVLQAAGVILGYPTIVILLLGVIAGVVIGVIPGMGGAVGTSVLLPVTIPMDAQNAVIFLMGIYAGAMYGGSVTAILINTPGTAGAAVTTLDGYPMTRNSEGKTAITIAAVSSAFGMMLAGIGLFVVFQSLFPVLLMFQTHHFFLVAALGLTLIAIVSKGSMIKGLLMGVLGVMVATIGFAPVGGEVRFTFGLDQLYPGIDFVAVILGLFAIAEMIRLVNEQQTIARAGEIAGSIR
ncbi:MAG: tripartite tricarboxylate transporter permease, partial [Halobacteriales archaeon]|nr:tripartite tricarboxylate transporter permease [Halobacteriales archaeon]